MTSWRAYNPVCPECGAATHRLPSRVALVGGARPPVGEEHAPRSWEGTGRGNREYVTAWRRQFERRRKFGEEYPEMAPKKEAAAAHEGGFEKAPLTYRELAQRVSASSGDATKAAVRASRERTGEQASKNAEKQAD